MIGDGAEQGGLVRLTFTGGSAIEDTVPGSHPSGRYRESLQPSDSLITTSVLSANGVLKRQPSATQTTGKRNDPPSVDSEGGRYVLLANLFFTCSANRRHAIGLNLSVGP